MTSVGIDLQRKRSHVVVVVDDTTQLQSRRLAIDSEVFS